MKYKGKLGSIAIMLLCIACTTGEPKTGNEQVTEVANSQLNSSDPYKKRGRKIVKNTFDTLRTTLLAAIEKEDIQSAIAVCNVQALPLTATYASENISIRRSSLKVRNPENAPTEMEIAQLKYLSKMADQKTDITESIISGTDGKTHYFKAIHMQPLCLNCHGKAGEEIMPETLKKLKELYPGDQAINYSDKDFRGVWHISFANEQ
jgi:hypothetical protein